MTKLLVNNRPIKLAKLIGKGGEGTIYTIEGRSDEAVKVYHPNLRKSRNAKIAAMVDQKLAEKTSLISFPKALVNDEKGNFVGFTMKLVKGYRPIHELYNPKSRQQYFPKIDYRFILNTALNVTRAIGTVHNNNCIIGDLNHSGILVSSDSTVALIDADSFQIEHNGMLYPCLVGVPEFTPPELQGRNLSETRRLRSHDHFGLAVTIFQLLFMGKHPYAGVYPHKDLSMTEAIQQNRFAFSQLRSKMTMTSPPPGSLTLASFDGSIGLAFENAFGVDPNRRPDARNWVQILHSASQKVVRCSHVDSHYYIPNKQGCFWCDLQALLNFDYFPKIFGTSASINLNLASINDQIKFIQSFHFPRTDQILSIPKTSASDGSTFYKKQKSSLDNRKFWGWIGVITLGCMIFVAPAFWLLWVLVGGYGLYKNRALELDPQPFESEFHNAKEGVNKTLKGLVSKHNLLELFKMQADLKEIIIDFQEQDAAHNKVLQIVRTNRKERKTYEFLDKYYIKDANIEGIGSIKKRLLIYAGIETAADINYAAVSSIFGFGPSNTSKVISWQKQLLSRFVYSQTLDSSDRKLENQIKNFFDHNKQQLSVRIKRGADQLRKQQANIENFRRDLNTNRTLKDDLQALVDTHADLLKVGKNVTFPELGVTGGYVSNYRKLDRNPPNLPIFQSPVKSSQNVAVSRTTTTATKKSKSRKYTAATSIPSCPRCNSKMIRRTGRYGAFWGCTTYPRCKGTRNI